MTRRPIPWLLLLVPLAACRTPVPQQELQVSDVEAYWAIDSTVGDQQYIAPVARFRVTSKFGEPETSVQATATFRRKGEEEIDWGSAWVEVSSRKKPLAPGQSTQVTMKSDGRYHSSGDPEKFFEHRLFRDAHVTVFLRIGSSNWEKFAEADVPRHIGSKALAEASR
jgi:hypothetical protein